MSSAVESRPVPLKGTHRERPTRADTTTNGLSKGPLKVNTERKKTSDHVYEAKRVEYEKKVKAIEDELAILKPKIAKISESIRTLNANDGNAAKREELRAKISALRTEKDKLRAQKEPVLLKLNHLQDSLKAKLDALSQAKDKIQYKKPEDIDKKIQALELQIESGSLKLIDEKKVVAEISKLRKARRDFHSFSGEEQSIADIRKSIDSIKQGLVEKDKAFKDLDEELKSVNAELTKLSSSRSANQGKIKALIQEREGISKKIDALYADKSAAYEEFQKANAAHRIWMEADQLRREEEYLRRDIERAIHDLENEMKQLELPAHNDKIEQCLNLQTYFRVHVLKTETAQAMAISSQSTTSNRPIEKLDETQILRKEQVQDNYSVTQQRKPKKVSHTAFTPAASTPASLKMPFWVISALEELGLSLVVSVDDAQTRVQELENVKKRFQDEQSAKLSNVDHEKSALNHKIDAQKARLANVPSEAATRVASKKKADGKTEGKKDAKQQPATSPIEN